jgi:hypothetical protein
MLSEEAFMPAPTSIETEYPVANSVVSALGGSYEVARIASDVGLSSHDLREMMNLGWGSKKQCQRDLARDPENSVWRQYCPNEGTLVALQGSAAIGH